MIWRLTYCNKDGVEARLDIIRGASTPVEVIEGTATPFILNYKLDKPDKSGFFMTSSADISIFETPTFNIDNLKTSSETEIKVEHYINGVLDWSGFVIPDFFSKTIGTPATVEMVASDRLGTLKGVTLDDLNQYESMRSLAVKCLAKTGLSLPLYTMADFVNNSQTNAFFKSLGLAGRLSDTKGRNISCYDILKSILVASNSKLVQQSGAWYIVNKFQHEQGAGNLFSTLTASTAYSEQTVNFSDVHVGARRTIIPVAATTGVFHEFGGGRSYPDNFDFRDGLSGWTTAGTFVATIDNREITGYDFGPIGATIRFGGSTEKNYLLNKNVFNVANYIQSANIDVPYDTGRIEVVLDINAIGPRMAQAIAAANLRVSVGATDGSQTLWLNTSGLFQSGSVIIHNLYFSRGVGNFETANFSVKGVLEQPSGYNVFVRIYGSNEAALDLRETAINFATISFNNTIESPKGLIYRRNQGTGFTKEHDIDTTIFGDYMRKGLDGYFYEYRIDDTSSLYSTAGTLTEPLWTAYGDTEQLPLLRHVTRQKSRMFSVAHNMISAKIDVATFKPLNIFVDCNSVNPRHVVVSATYDFLRSEVEVELEQIAYATLDVREFIYSYFGDGESGISSVGGISGGGTGTGGGMTPEQLELLNTVAGYWTLDENGNLKTTYNAYSEKELSAYGFGGSGGGGGGGGSLVTWSNETTEKVTLTVEGIAKDLSKLGHTHSWSQITNKPTTFTPSAHTHAIADVTGLQTALNGKFNNPTGTTTQYLRGDGSLATFPAIPQGTVTSVGLSAPTGFTVSGSPVTSSGTLALTFTAGYSLPTTAKQTAWDNHLTATNNPHGVTASQVGALALTGGTMSNTNLVTNLNADLLDGQHGDWYRENMLQFTAIPLIQSAGASDLNTILQGGGMVSNYYGSILWTNAPENAFGAAIELTNGTTLPSQLFWSINHNVANATRNLYFRTKNNLGYGQWERIAFTTSNVASATKLQTARTIWGQSFDGTGNISGALTGVTTLSASSTLSATTGIFSNLTANYLPKHTASGLVNSQIFDNGTNVGIGTTSPSSKLSFGNYFVNSPTPTAAKTVSHIRLYDTALIYYGFGVSLNALNIAAQQSTGTIRFHTNFAERAVINASGNVGIGTTSPSYKLDVSGTGRFTGNLTAPKVIFSAAGWAMVQVGTELQMQYNGVAKMRFLNGGSIVAVEEITAYG